MSNSIISENGSKNCVFADGDKTQFINNLTKTSDCGSGNSTDPNIEIGSNTLLAGELEGKCNAAPAEGLPVSYTHLRAHETLQAISYAVFCLSSITFAF